MDVSTSRRRECIVLRDVTYEDLKAIEHVASILADMVGTGLHWGDGPSVHSTDIRIAYNVLDVLVLEVENAIRN